MMIRTCCLVLLSAALIACQRSQSAPEEPGSAPEAAVVAPPAAGEAGSRRPRLGAGPGEIAMSERDTASVDARIIDVRLSKVGDTEANAIGMPASDFSPQDTVYAEVQTTGTTSGYSLYAKWLAPDGTVLADYGMRINEAGPKRTVISLSKPDGWNKGQGRIELAINGKTERIVSFAVQ